MMTLHMLLHTMCSESLNFKQTTGIHSDSLMISTLFWVITISVQLSYKVPVIKPEFIADTYVL
jgi:hypothetical protein